MLPELPKKKSADPITETRNSQPRLNSGDPIMNDVRAQTKSVSAKKVRTGGGFMKASLAEEIEYKQLPAPKLGHLDNLQKFVKVRRTEDLAAEIKLIEKKIKACQKKLEQDRKREKQLEQQATRDQEKPEYNFEAVVQRELQMQGYQQPEQNDKNFDYLTNPRLHPAEQQQTVEVSEKPLIIQQKQYDIGGSIEKLQKFYQNSLKKKFERREMFPHQACRRITPKLYITQKTNALSKYGRAQNQTQHLFRVMTKETTPQQIYPTIPNFAVVKDNLSKNIVAYLGDYKPFLQKTKEGVERINMNDKKQKQPGRESQGDIGTDNKAHELLKIGEGNKIKTKEREQSQA